ncbi:MAG: divergent polysaccharide deacetylase family protein [Candidatus Eisenbacteria bacterium]|nr:divergent polysaccharide deacetylase family protein [Candidatus Eisenbacteria bacterium]
MPRGKSRSARDEARARALSLARIWTITLAAGVVVVLGAIELSTSGRLSGLFERFRGTTDLSRVVLDLDRAVDGTLVKLGVSGMTGESEERSGGQYVWRHQEKKGNLPYGTSLYETNLAITREVREAGGRIIRASEEPADWRGLKALEMRIGVGDVETHTLFLRESGRSTGGEGARRAAVGKPMIAIVIDDFGYNRSEAALGILDLDYSITVSVLPNCPMTKELAEYAHRAGKEIIAHVPMEPAAYPEADPGEAALMTGQTRDQIARLTEAALDDIPYAVGASNHMGSAFTAYHIPMRVFMSCVSKRGIYFLDSMTTPSSVGIAEAERAGVPAARNRMFIDSPLDEQGRVDVDSQLLELAAVARRNGSAIGIGHPHPETLRALKRRLPELMSQGFEFVFVSRLVR